jgi:hypothetical protein
VTACSATVLKAELTEENEDAEDADRAEDADHADLADHAKGRTGPVNGLVRTNCLLGVIRVP